MSKATRILNEYHIKELILKGNPQYENFYKEELIEFCKISKQEIERLNNIINECSDDILKELKENHHLSYGVALSIRNKLLDYKELKEDNK